MFCYVINFKVPARKIYCYLSYILVSLANEKLSIPVTCKIRVFEDIGKTVEYAKMLERAGAKVGQLYLCYYRREYKEQQPLPSFEFAFTNFIQPVIPEAWAQSMLVFVLPLTCSKRPFHLMHAMTLAHDTHAD